MMENLEWLLNIVKENEYVSSLKKLTKDLVLERLACQF